MSFSYCFSNLGVNLRLYSESTKFARVIHAKKLYARLNLIFFNTAVRLNFQMQKNDLIRLYNILIIRKHFFEKLSFGDFSNSNRFNSKSDIIY